MTGERIAALDGIGELKSEVVEKDVGGALSRERQRESRAGSAGKERPATSSKYRGAPALERGWGGGMDLGL